MQNFVELLKALLIEERGHSPEIAAAMILANQDIVTGGMLVGNSYLRRSAIALEGRGIPTEIDGAEMRFEALVDSMRPPERDPVLTKWDELTSKIAACEARCLMLCGIRPTTVFMGPAAYHAFRMAMGHPATEVRMGRDLQLALSDNLFGMNVKQLQVDGVSVGVEYTA